MSVGAGGRLFFNRFSKSTKASGVGLRRYFRTKALTPRAANALATFQPSFSIDNHIMPPPGATSTLVPLAMAGSAKNGVSVASLTLRAMGTPHWKNQDSAAGWFATPPVFKGIALGSAGASIGVIFPSWANTLKDSKHTASSNTLRNIMVNLRFYSLFIYFRHALSRVSDLIVSRYENFDREYRVLLLNARKYQSPLSG